MNPLEARFIIEKLINDHGPDCVETGHELVIEADGSACLIHKGYKWPAGTIPVCKVCKAGMKQGFIAKTWDEIGEALSKAINKKERESCKS